MSTDPMEDTQPLRLVDPITAARWRSIAGVPDDTIVLDAASPEEVAAMDMREVRLDDLVVYWAEGSRRSDGRADHGIDCVGPAHGNPDNAYTSHFYLCATPEEALEKYRAAHQDSA